MNPDVDYASLYRDLSSKCKKKIFRKANITEARDDFAFLAKTLAAEDTPEYSGVFALGKAKCEAQLNNAIGEAAALLEAAACFLRAEENLTLTSSFSIRENLDFFVSCSLKAARIYEMNDHLTFASSVYIHIGDTLMKFESYDAALPILSQAADIFCRDAPRSMHVLSKCARCQIFMRDYVGALTTYQRMQALILDAYATHDYEPELFFDYMKSCEIFRVLLILLTTPPPSLKHDSEQVGAYSLKAYLTGGQGPSEACVAGLLDSDLFLLLKSLIMAYKSSNINELEYTATYLQSHVSLVQRKLLCDLLEELINPLGG